MSALRAILRAAIRVDRSGLAAGFGVRCAVGVGVPLLIGSLSGHVLAGISASFGALVAGFASRQAGYRRRAVAMLLTTLALAVSAFAGEAGADVPAVIVAITAIWCLAFGLLPALGPSAITVSVNAIVAVLLFSHAPYRSGDAFAQALYVIGGGALQTALLILVWPLQGFSAERRLLRAAYASLATFAGRQNAGLGAPESASIVAISATAGDPHPFGNRAEIAAYAALADEAERLRGALAAVATETHLLEDVGMSGPSGALRALAHAVVPLLTEIATAISERRAPDAPTETWRALEDARARVRAYDLDGTAPFVADADAARAAVVAAWRAAAAAASGGVSRSISRAIAERDERVPVDRGTRAILDADALRDAIDTLLANVSLDSVYARHALRLTVIVTIAGIVEHLVPLEHGNWIGLTAVLVLRPDFSTTFSRGFARVIGTVGGGLIASLVAALHPAHEAYVMLAILCAGMSYAFFAMSYALFSATITGYVVFLLAAGGSAEHTAAFDRVVAALIGGALALTAYAAWPTWSRAHVAGDLAALIDAQRRYAALVLGAYVAPAARDGTLIRRAQTAAWLARSNAEASVEALAGEPVVAGALSIRAALAFLAATRRFGVALLTLRSRIARDADEPRAMLEPLVADLDLALQAVGETLRTGRPVVIPRLQADQRALRAALAVHPNAHLEVLLTETDLIVESVVAMGRELAPPSAG